MKNSKPLWGNSDLPVIQAPMAGGATTPELVAAVSNSGGLGSLAAGYLKAKEIRNSIQKIRRLTSEPFAVNLFIPEKHEASPEQIETARKAVQACCQELNFEIKSIKPPYAPPFDEQISVILDEKVPFFSFTFGLPSPNWIKRFKKSGIMLIGTATTLEEAKLLEENHIDFIVAQGSEAGGHRGTFLKPAEDALIPTLALISQLKQNLSVPIIAAGGIMDSKGIVNALEKGAVGVQMGTAFLCCAESGISSFYKAILSTSQKNDTTLTRAFSGKLARGIRNQFITRMHDHLNTILAYPIQNALTTAMRQEALKQENTDFMSLWAGQAAYLCKTLPAAQLIQELKAGMLEYL